MRDALSAVAGAQAEEIRALVLENAGDEAKLTEAASAYSRYDLKLWITHSSGGATYLPR
jgi:hypothetical protein